ncbi:hypothetical protein WAI453_008394 [Rhynchosporium graminicola]
MDAEINGIASSLMDIGSTASQEKWTVAFRKPDNGNPGCTNDDQAYPEKPSPAQSWRNEARDCWSDDWADTSSL